MRRFPLWPFLTLLAAIAPAAQTTPAPATAAPNYANPAAWVCRPGSEDICTSGLDAVQVFPDGRRVAAPFTPAANPPIDCFYVYPTVSREPTDFADMTDSPEVQRVTKVQAGRLTSRCRLFVPIYRQATLAQLHGGNMDFSLPIQDVRAAFLYYLQHDNHGRGVVLIGHSQGSILLQSLIAQAIDGRPVQSIVVSAILAGDPSLGVPPGKLVGGTFPHIPVCAAAAQTGCVYPWGSYAAGDTSTQIFGAIRKDGLISACANPAAPSGGPAPLKFFRSKPASAAADDPPWIESIGQLTGACESSSTGNAFRVKVQPGPDAATYTQILKSAQTTSGWGLHTLDLNLVQGNILDVLDAETTTWTKSHP